MSDATPATTEDHDEICGGIAPDDCCGSCSDCLDALDDWREINGEDA